MSYNWREYRERLIIRAFQWSPSVPQDYPVIIKEDGLPYVATKTGDVRLRAYDWVVKYPNEHFHKVVSTEQFHNLFIRVSKRFGGT